MTSAAARSTTMSPWTFARASPIDLGCGRVGSEIDAHPNRRNEVTTPMIEARILVMLPSMKKWDSYYYEVVVYTSTGAEMKLVRHVRAEPVAEQMALAVRVPYPNAIKYGIPTVKKVIAVDVDGWKEVLAIIGTSLTIKDPVMG